MSLAQFEEEQIQIRKEIWSLIRVKKLLVIDVGVGVDATSTQMLIEKGAAVIAIDTDIEALMKHREIAASFVCCDVRYPPFKRNAADCVTFLYTLHEINPAFHRTMISELAPMSLKIVIVEPSPGNTPGYQCFENLWRESMHAVGYFEDYEPLSYWKHLVRTNGFEIELARKIEHTVHVPPEKIKSMVDFTVEWFKREDVPQAYLERAQTLETIKEEEIKLSDITIVIGKSRMRQ